MAWLLSRSQLDTPWTASSSRPHWQLPARAGKTRHHADLTAMQLMCTRMAHLAENDQLTETLARHPGQMFTSRKALDMCRTARDMLAGNGILLENHIGRHLTDMEVVSTYEGTDSMQAPLWAAKSPVFLRSRANGNNQRQVTVELSRSPGTRTPGLQFSSRFAARRCWT